MALKKITDPELLAQLNGEQPSATTGGVPPQGGAWDRLPEDMERIGESIPTMKRMDHGPLPQSTLKDYLDIASTDFLSGVTAENASGLADVTAPKDSFMKEVVGGGAHMAGMGLNLAATMGTGVNPIAAFGAYGGLKPADSVSGRAKNIAADAAFGSVMHIVPKTLVNLVYKNLGTASAQEFGKFLSKRPTRAVSDFVLFAGMNLQSGMPVKSAIASAAGASFGAQAIPSNVFGRDAGKAKAADLAGKQQKREWTFDPQVAKYKRPMDLEALRNDPRLNDATPYSQAEIGSVNIPRIAERSFYQRLEAIEKASRDKELLRKNNLKEDIERANAGRDDVAERSRPDRSDAQLFGRYNAAGPAPGRPYSGNKYPYMFTTQDAPAPPVGGPPGTAKDVTLGVGLGGLGDFSLMPKSGKYKDIISAELRPLEGVPESVPMSDYVKGNISAKELVAWFAQNKEQIGGVVTEKKLNEATKEYLVEKKRKSLERRIEKGEAVEPGELEAFKAKTSSEIDSGKRGYKKYHEESEVKRIAQEMAVPADVQKQIAKDQVGDLNPHWTNIVDKRRAIQGISGGVQDRPIEMHTQRLGELSEQVSLRLANDMKTEASRTLTAAGIKQGSPESSALGRVLDKFKNDMSVAEFLGTPEATEILSEIKPENRGNIMRAAVDLRGQFKEQWELRNSLSETYTGEGIGKLEAYFPKKEKSYSWRNPVKKIEKATRPDKYRRSREGSRVEDVKDTHEMHRTGKEIDRDFDSYNVIDSYIGKTSDRIANQIVIRSGEAVATSLEAAGHVASSDAMRRVMQSSYAGRSHGLNRMINDWLGSSRPGKGAMGGSRWAKQQFNHAKYTFNIPFMVARQWTSSGLMSSMPDISPKMVAETMAEMWGKEASALYKTTYTGKMKSQRMSGMGSEGRAGSVTDAVTMRRGKVETAIDFAQKPTSKVEEMAGRFSAVLAAKIANKQGMTPEMASRFVSDAIAKTQSEYHNASRAEILKNPVMNFLVPAQSFSVEQLNNILEIYSPNVGLKRYKTTAQKNAAMARTFATMALLGTAYEYINSHADWGDGEEAVKGSLKHLGKVAASYVPGSSMVVPGGPSSGQLYPYVLVEDSVKALAYAWNGDMARAFGQIGKDLAPGGAQLNRAISTDRMISKGILDESERWKGSTMGWWTTESGKEYLRNVKGMNSGKDTGMIEMEAIPMKEMKVIGGPGR